MMPTGCCYNFHPPTMPAMRRPAWGLELAAITIKRLFERFNILKI